MKKKIIIIILILIILYASGGIVYIFLSKTEEQEKKNISTIKNYPYTLKANATEIQKEEFNILKETLEQSKRDEDVYMQQIAKLYTLDLYTLSNKNSKHDIETQYIYQDAIESFKLNVVNTLYKYIDPKSKESYPEVSGVTIESKEESEYEIDKNMYTAINFEIKIDYKEDLGYDDKVVISLIKQDNLYYVVESTNA